MLNLRTEPGRRTALTSDELDANFLMLRALAGTSTDLILRAQRTTPLTWEELDLNFINLQMDTGKLSAEVTTYKSKSGPLTWQELDANFVSMAVALGSDVTLDWSYVAPDYFIQ